jgi:hypothetical protein
MIQKRASRVDQGRKPIRNAGAAEATAHDRPERIGDEQRQPVERLGDAGQYFGGVISEQP